MLSKVNRQFFTSENELINFIKELVNSKSTLYGIGDDAAVLDWEDSILIATTDALVEDVHFKLTWVTPEFLGRKAALVNLSDIAAMGGKPLYALVSLMLPRLSFTKLFIKKLYQGLMAEFNPMGANIVGGNISSAKELSITLTVIGSLNGKALTRNSAKASDALFVTGNLGLATAELYLLKSGIKKTAQVLPPNRIKFAQELVKQNLASSGIDISDGLALDLHHLCQESRVGALVYENYLPVRDDLKVLSRKYNQDLNQWVLHGGEDYELLFTAKKEKVGKIFEIGQKTDTQVGVIGEIKIRHYGIKLQKTSGNLISLKAKGWDHIHPD